MNQDSNINLREAIQEQSLSAYQRRLWVEVDRILYQNYLTPRTVTDFWKGDNEAIIAHLKQMKDRVIRSVVILTYVEVDDLLNRVIMEVLLGKARRRRSDRRFSTLNAMLDRLYPQQKIDILRSHHKVPDEICRHVMALNTIRNNFAHRYHLAEIPKSRRLYKGKYNVFTKKGLEKFQADMWEVSAYFDPYISKISLELVRNQRARNSRGLTNRSTRQAG